MCQSTKQGGKRCAAHMHGSTATVTMTSIVTSTAADIVRKIFTGLRKEGKNLPAPSQAEIIALAENNKMMARFDPTIPDSRRNSLTKRWESAKTETPDGGTFHAWRHTLGETIRSGFMNSRKTFAAVGIAGTLLFASACSGGNMPHDPSSAPVTSPTTISTSASPTATAPVVKGLPTKGVADTGKGKYLQTTIADTDPAMKYDPSLATPTATKMYSAKDLAEVQKKAVKFMAEEGIDSTANDGNGEAWWAVHGTDFSPSLQVQAHEGIVKQTGIIATDAVLGGKYTYDYNANKPRIENRNLTVTKIDVLPSGAIAVHAKAQYDINVIDNATKEHTKITGVAVMAYSYVRDSTTQKWVISGYQNQFNGYAK